MTIYTAFCQESDGTGTIWIDTVEADNETDAIAEARRACCEDWGWEDFTNVHCLGLAEGDINIVFWDD